MLGKLNSGENELDSEKKPGELKENTLDVAVFVWFEEVGGEGAEADAYQEGYHWRAVSRTKPGNGVTETRQASLR